MHLSLIANFDHGCCKASGSENPSNIEGRASLNADGTQKPWFHHWFCGTSKASYSPVDLQPHLRSMTNCL